MKIAIDCRALRGTPSGISNFLELTIDYLTEFYPDWEVFLLTNEKFHPAYDSKIYNKKNVHLIVSPLFFAKKVSFIWLVVKASFIVNKIKPDLYWSPAFLLPPFLSKKIKTLVTVHDVVYKEHAHTMSFLGKLYARFLQDTSINKADKIWANSEYTALAIDKYYTNRRSKQIFKGFFINSKIFKQAVIGEKQKVEILKKYNIPEQFFLFVGTLEPRKNITFLLSLMPHLIHLNIKLLIVGVKGWGNTHIKQILGAKDYPKSSVVFSGFVPTYDLVNLYNLATLFISTSTNEGFGMPQLEAMACGCPVICPHNSAMIEVVAGAGETVRTWEVNNWVEAIEKVIKNRNYYVKQGLNRVQEYEPSTVIHNLFKYLNSL